MGEGRGVDWRELLLKPVLLLFSVMVEKLGSWLEAEGLWVGTKGR